MLESTENPITLIYAKSPEYSTTSAYYIEGYVLVRKPASSKSVTIHYTYDHKSWFTCPATFLKATKDNHEVWYFKTPSTYIHKSCSFALCYKADDEEYWDNNHSINYILKWYSPTKVLQSCNIVLDKALKNCQTFYGNILVKNLGYQKKLTVRYSLDQWETFSEIDAVHSFQSPNSLENWTFSVPLSFSSEIRFIVYYTVNGTTYFDNNFGMDYLI